MTDKPALKILLQLAIAALVLSAGSAHAIELSQSLQPTSIQFEERAQFEIVISWPGPQSRYFFPKPLRPQFEKLTAGELSSAISSIGSGANEITTKRYRYTLIPSLSGLGRIEAIAIEYISWPDSVPGQLLTEPMTISIANPKPAPPADSDDGLGFWLILIGSVLVVSGGVLYYLLVIRGKASSTVQVSPEQAFVVSLNLLQKECSDDLKQFQTGLYKLLVEYLNLRFQITSESRLVRDLSEQLKATNLPADQREMISAWLVRAEKEKFTPVTASPGATMRLAAEIRQFFETKLTKTLK